MKRFEFKLDPVIRYRRHLERIALMELAKAKQELVHTKKKILALERSKEDVGKELNARQSEGLEVCRYQIYAAYLQGIEDRIEFENGRLVEIGKAILEKHKAAEAERTRKESVELIRRNEYRKYVDRALKAEQKAADELFSLRRRSPDGSWI